MSKKSSQEWICEKCGNSLIDIYQYCTNCGSPRQNSSVWFCRNCSKEVPSEVYKYCIHCGAKKENEKTSLILAKPKVSISVPKIGVNKSKKEFESPILYCPAGYSIIDKIGSGGFGDVFRAKDPKGRVAALKFPRIEIEDTISQSYFEQLSKEGKIWSRLKHPNIVEVFECGMTPMPWISMELMEGGSLSDRLKKGPLEIKQALQIALKIADALQLAHHNGVIHQDIKPKNILFTNAGTPKLTDWGLVKIMLETSSSIDVFQGTVMCAAPEQIDSKCFGNVDWRTDIYSFGVVLYWMIAGKPPFYAEDLLGYIKKLTEEKIKPLRETNSSIPEKLDTVLAKTLAKLKEERYQAIALLKEDIEKILSDLK